jgi:queuosine precursor transporter
MGSKTVPLFSIGSFHFNGGVGLLLIPLIYSINDIITEVYGKEKTRSIVRSSLVMIFFILIFSLIAVALPATTRFMPLEKSYDAIFTFSARISAASLIAFAVGEFSDVFIYYKIRQKLGKKALWFRTNASNFLSQFLDTTLFLTLAFYALDKSFVSNFSFLSGLILSYWLLKCFMSIIETPLVYLGVSWLKRDKKD